MAENPRQSERQGLENPEGRQPISRTARGTSTNVRGRSRGGRAGSSRGVPSEPEQSLQESSSSDRARGRGRGRGRGRSQNTEYVTRADLAAELNKFQESLQENLQVWFGHPYYAEDEITEGPESIHEEEIPISTVVVPKGYDFKMFSACKPPSYSGERDPVKAMEWLKEIESAFRTSKCADKDKVLFGSAMLKSDALYWWEVVASSKGSDVYETLAWEEFSTAFKVQFCPQADV